MAEGPAGRRTQPRMSPRLTFGINSALAFACAALMMVPLHETGHGLVAQALGFAPKIYAVYEDNPAGTAFQTLAILAGGPLTSLVLGSIFLAWSRRGPARYGFGRLLLFWMGLLGVMNFVNYLVVTPFLAVGDSAQFANTLGWPLAARYAMALLGVAAVIALGRPIAAAMFAVAPSDFALDTPRDRRRLVIWGFYMPLFAGVALCAPAGIGTPLWLVGVGLLGDIGNIDVVVAALYAGGEPPEKRRTDAPLRFEFGALGLYVALVLFSVLVLSKGLPV